MAARQMNVRSWRTHALCLSSRWYELWWISNKLCVAPATCLTLSAIQLKPIVYKYCLFVYDILMKTARQHLNSRYGRIIRPLKMANDDNTQCVTRHGEKSQFDSSPLSLGRFRAKRDDSASMWIFDLSAIRMWKAWRCLHSNQHCNRRGSVVA